MLHLFLRVSSKYIQEAGTSEISTEMALMKNKFPEGFMWAIATASYQIEGGWDEDGKSFVHCTQY